MQVSSIISILNELDPDMDLSSRDLSNLISGSVPSREEVESICSARNLDADCSFIADLLSPVLMRIENLLEDENSQLIAVKSLLMVIEVLQDHYIEDEHYCWFDDFYSPDYSLESTYSQFKKRLDEGTLSKEASILLGVGLERVLEHAAYTEYNMPSFI